MDFGNQKSQQLKKSTRGGFPEYVDVQLKVELNDSVAHEFSDYQKVQFEIPWPTIVDS